MKCLSEYVFVYYQTVLNTGSSLLQISIQIQRTTFADEVAVRKHFNQCSLELTYTSEMS